MYNLPIVLLSGFPFNLQARPCVPVSKLVYGTNLRLPAPRIDSSTPEVSLDLLSYVNRLQEAMGALRPVPTLGGSTGKSLYHPSFPKSTHNFLRLVPNANHCTLYSTVFFLSSVVLWSFTSCNYPAVRILKNPLTVGCLPFSTSLTYQIYLT